MLSIKKLIEINVNERSKISSVAVGKPNNQRNSSATISMARPPTRPDQKPARRILSQGRRAFGEGLSPSCDKELITGRRRERNGLFQTRPNRTYRSCKTYRTYLLIRI